MQFRTEETAFWFHGRFSHFNTASSGFDREEFQVYSVFIRRGAPTEENENSTEQGEEPLRHILVFHGAGVSIDDESGTPGVLCKFGFIPEPGGTICLSGLFASARVTITSANLEVSGSFGATYMDG
ncbi:MAG: hypothetical protein JWM68_3561 [Verrucomicrobiales bacterium]|nr:hypothetical protein [Verrucomicrobiales bacterium]